ncbi:MAG: ABC transporter ATP-binding protein [Methanocalculaceae archaeon]|jgi:zinc transport system ATP-binding protein|nr:ABC transporter ATP-binding protein [Methanocalculaceae archaeon]
MNEILEADYLVVERSGHVVLDGVSFVLYKGDVAAIIGPNGGGKTSFLRTILGLIHPKSGSIKIFGKSPAAARSRIGYVPQMRSFDFSYPMTVQQMVLTGRLGHIPGLVKRYRPKDYTAAAKALALMGLTGYRNRPIAELSGGEQQRAAISRALAGEPELLILDEPTVYVDGPTGERLMTLLEDLRSKMTVLMVTHDISAMSGHVNRVACLNRKLFIHDTGRITSDMVAAAYGCPVELITHGHVPHRVLAGHEEEKP